MLPQEKSGVASVAKIFTRDGQDLFHGLKVWTYDLRRGTVDLTTLDQHGWFQVNYEDGDYMLVQASRVAVFHPFTKEKA